jgi:hypothetical protein
MTISEFKDYLASTPVTFSYKAVMVLALLDAVDQHGKASESALIARFHAFYLDRQRRNLPTEKERDRNPSPLLNPDEVSDAQIWQILARYPLPLMDEFITMDDDSVWIKPTIWAQMSAADLVDLREIAQQRIESYYEGVE